jgi:hypothetical protein
VVWAIIEGREAARHIDEYLMGRPGALAARAVRTEGRLKISVRKAEAREPAPSPESKP